MSVARFYVGDVLDVLDVLADLEPDSVDLVLTSPPFLALRSYLPADHPDKDKEGGAQATPGEFIDWLLDVTEALDRVLAPHGSLCVELGDTYAGSGGAGGDYGDAGLRAGQMTYRQKQQVAPKRGSGPRLSDRLHRATTSNKNRDKRPGWPLDKSLTLVPELYRFALAYGFNPLTGRETDRWRVRNVVRWVRPNPPVGALGDKFRPATSELVVACKAQNRYFDLDAVREKLAASTLERAEGSRRLGGKSVEDSPTASHGRDFPINRSNPAGAPPLDWWEIPTKPYKGAHYATFPPALCERPIEAMCPQRVCRTCGDPSRRMVETHHEPNRNTNGPQSIEKAHIKGGSAGYAQRADRVTTTIGWTDCGHDDWRTGIVLDPFAGSGTVLEVATGHGRDAIGIDLDERNLDLARQRVGMFLEVDETQRP